MVGEELGKMAEASWDGAGLRLREVDGGLLVDQEGRRYVGRRWALTPAVRRVIDLAIAHSFTKMWVNGHPSDAYVHMYEDGDKRGDKYEQGSHHLTFARAHDEAWTFVLGHEAKPPGLRWVTFNKRLADRIERSKVSYRWEHAGGHNVLVVPDALPDLLAALAASDLPELRTRTIRGHTVLPLTELANEQHVEEAFVRLVRHKGSADMEVRRRVDGLIPDVILRPRGEPLIVVELKYPSTGQSAVDQLRGYMNLPTLQAESGSHGLTGALIARDFDDAARRDAERLGIALYRYGYDDQLHLQHVLGPPFLEAVGLLAPTY